MKVTIDRAGFGLAASTPLFIIFVGILIVLSGSLAHGGENRIILAVGVENFWPISYEEKGKATGPYNEIVYEAFNRMEQTVDIRLFPWKRCLRMIERGKAMILIGPFYSKDRAEYMEYILSTPIYKLNTSLFLRKEDVKSGLYRGSESLYGKKIGIMRGAVYSEEFEKAKRDGMLTAVELPNVEQMILMAKKGRLDAFLHTTSVCKAYLEKHQLDNEFVALEPKVTPDRNAYLAFSRAALSSEQAKRLFAKLEKTLAEMKKDGTLSKLGKE